MVKPAKIYPIEYYMKEVKVITFLGKREIPEAKTLKYLKAIRAPRKDRSENAEDALCTSEGLIHECTVCSFFGVKEQRTITAEDVIHNRITKKTVIELIKDKIQIDYKFIHVSEISTLDEVFLASLGHGIKPVVPIDKTTVGKPESITKRIMKESEAYTGNGL